MGKVLPSLTLIDIASGEPQLFAALVNGFEETAETDSTVALLFQALKEVRVGVTLRTAYADNDIECMLKCLRKRMNLGMALRS